MFDLVVALSLVTLMLPILIVVWLLVRTTSPGKALFRQTRIGRLGRPFVMYKFRSMHDGCDDTIHREYVRKLLTDDIRPAGGERAFTSSRLIHGSPESAGCCARPASTSSLSCSTSSAAICHWSDRGPLCRGRPSCSAPPTAPVLVPPGMTGLWQVSGRSKLPMQQGLDLDLEYVQSRSFWLDLQILVKTLPAVSLPGGAVTADPDRMVITRPPTRPVRSRRRSAGPRGRPRPALDRGGRLDA